MIAQLVSWFLAFAAVFVFGMIWGLEVGSKRGWHRGRAALIREQRLGPPVDCADIVDGLRPHQFFDHDGHRHFGDNSTRALFDQEAEA